MMVVVVVGGGAALGGGYIREERSRVHISVTAHDDNLSTVV